MSKIKLTQEQARMFENHKYAVKTLLQKRVCDNCPTSIDDVPIDDVVKAIVYGYEVEPEYEEGDWVIYNGKVVQIVGITKGYSPITPHEINFAIDDDDWYDYQKIESHATPSEIAEEKERRWWKKHGREPWELEDRDLLIDSTGEIYTVWIGDNEFDLTSNGDVVLSVCDPKILRDSFEVLCFAENRLDVKDDE